MNPEVIGLIGNALTLTLMLLGLAACIELWWFDD